MRLLHVEGPDAVVCSFTVVLYMAMHAAFSLGTKFGCPVFAVFCSNQFGFQEPGNSAEIKNFASGKGFKGLLMEKIDVNGPKASPVYAFLKVGVIAQQL